MGLPWSPARDVETQSPKVSVEGTGPFPIEGLEIRGNLPVEIKEVVFQWEAEDGDWVLHIRVFGVRPSPMHPHTLIQVGVNRALWVSRDTFRGSPPEEWILHNLRCMLLEMTRTGVEP